jgi:hypothetical protein
MKKTFLFCTKIRLYLIELPLIVLLAFAYHFNERSDALTKLYPLIIFIILVILFIFVYFFRGIMISTEEISDVGLFSGRDRAEITKDKTVIITMKSRARLSVELFGNDGTPPSLDWLKGEDYTPVDIYLFRGKAIGGKRAVKRVLSVFGVASSDLQSIFTLDSFSADYDIASVSVTKKEDIREIKIKITETV